MTILTRIRNVFTGEIDKTLTDATNNLHEAVREIATWEKVQNGSQEILVRYEATIKKQDEALNLLNIGNQRLMNHIIGQAQVIDMLLMAIRTSAESGVAPRIEDTNGLWGRH